ncbi:MAG TPA: DNA mismatch repair protein MutS, partial [Candidatus Bathyarchaeia archaeon]|nr:DNA mismatch repair protein MutS [Candidatus Bathyarchaeia archaeon]
MSTQTETPMLQQYRSIKAKHQDCILFFRLGDFYEMFYEDAQVASGILDLVLTSRGKGTANHVPMCGIPYHSADSYISKLIRSGFKVAICEQVEDPALAKGIVRRDVIRVITSGTFLDEQSADALYILCLSPNGKETGLAFIDPASGTIQTNQYAETNRCVEILARLPVYECVYPQAAQDAIKAFFNHPLLRSKEIMLSPHEDWCFNKEIAQKNLCEHFRLPNLRGFGIQDMPIAISSAGALLEYLKQMNQQPLKHVDKITLYADEHYAFISPAAIYGLELNTLFKTINATLCALGKRKLHFWLHHPLKNPAKILERQEAVTLLKDRPKLQEQFKRLLSQMPDVEKSISKLSCGYSDAKDILFIRNALCLIPEIQQAIREIQDLNPLFRLNDIKELRQLLERAINPEMPITKNEGKVIQKRFHQQLDELRDIQNNGREWLKHFQQREIQRSGINSLKVGYNRVFGYYIEITKTRLASVPQDYIRKQTLVNGERFITQELKEYEEKILTAQEQILKIEQELVLKLQQDILEHSVALHQLARDIARLDALYALCLLAQRPGYVAPLLNDGTLIDIRDGRHPVVEQSLETNFVPNDTLLDSDENHLIILTGPNMAGKSTYIRQIAILIILAQMGSYIPASSATIGTVDKIFTRIGAHDDIAKGQSTFMVEMNEMADILNNLSARSLVILDEIGRGTSTYDGLSLAWALAEHLQKTPARTLFATHFHELTALANDFPGVKNYNVAVKEWKDRV